MKKLNLLAGLVLLMAGGLYAATPEATPKPSPSPASTPCTYKLTVIIANPFPGAANEQPINLVPINITTGKTGPLDGIPATIVFAAGDTEKAFTFTGLCMGQYVFNYYLKKKYDKISIPASGPLHY